MLDTPALAPAPCPDPADATVPDAFGVLEPLASLCEGPAPDRRQTRTPVHASAIVMPMPAGEPFEVMLVDVSEGGVGLLSPRSFEDIDRFLVRIAGPDGHPRLAVARKVYARTEAAGHVRVGAAWVVSTHP